MHKLRLTCFNTFQVFLDGQPIVTFQRAKAQALLIYLAIERHQPHPRATLSGLLWPDYPEKSARRSFSKTLNALRTTIQKDSATPPFLDIGTHMIALNGQSDHWADVMQFEANLNSVRTHEHDRPAHCTDCTQRLQEATDLYTGPFLQGYGIAESDLFEHWIEATRQQLHQQAVDAFTQLSQAYIAQRRFPEALAAARRLIALAPWQEEAHRQLMLLLAQSGQRTQALAQYDQCAQMLMDELGVPPAPETDELYDLILSNEFSTESLIDQFTASQLSAAGQPFSVMAEKRVPFQAISIPPHFVGRSSEIQNLGAALKPKQGKSESTRLLALVGMGGVGKTTLAARIADDMRANFGDGVLWGNPAISSSLDILDLWGQAYGYDFSGLSDLASRSAAVRDMLAEKETLIVLDNVDDAADVRPLLPNGKQCAVLLTTRNQELAVALNADVHLLEELSLESGVQLLNQILGEERVQKEPGEAETICTLLHCLPLALEIAAQRLKSRLRMKLAAMVKRLQDTQQRLNLNISDQAVRTSFAVSWDGLDEELQRLFAIQGLFQGRPFSADAIAYLDDLDAFDAEDQLYDLVTLSLLRVEDIDSYYRQHPLLADFAKEKLDELEELENEEVEQKLVNYYLEFSEENCKNYELLEPEWGNITAAIETGHRLVQWEQVVKFTDFLEQTWLTRARYEDAKRAYQWAQVAAEKLENEEKKALNLLRWGKICIEQSVYDDARQYLSKSLTLYYQLEEGTGIADAQFELARMEFERGQYNKANQSLQECLTIRKMFDDEQGIAGVLYSQAWISSEYNDLDTASQLLHQARQTYETYDNKPRLVLVLRSLAEVEMKRGGYERAHIYCNQGYKIASKLQDEGELATFYYYWTMLYRKKGEFDKAKKFGKQAIQLLKRLGLRRLEGMTLYHLGHVLAKLDELAQAQIYILESIKISKAILNPLGTLFSLNFLGDLYRQLEQPENSKTVWLNAKTIAQELNYKEKLEELEQKLRTLS